MYATNYTDNHVYIYNFNADVLSWGVCLFVVVCLMVVCCVVVVVVVVFWGFFCCCCFLGSVLGFLFVFLWVLSEV